MNENKHNHHPQEGQDYILPRQEHRAHWKRIHHTWSFWIFLFLMLAAIIYYIMTVDFAFAPRVQLKQHSENSRTQ